MSNTPPAELLREHAQRMAAALRATADRGANEAEVRAEAVRQLAFLEDASAVKLDVHHEYTVASGRIDSVYLRVIVEYKNPSSPADRIGSSSSSAGTKKVVEQIKSRFADIERALGQPQPSLFGVGIDGRRIVFVRYRGGRWDVEAPADVTPASVERLLWALFNLSARGKPFSPDYLANDFGSSTEVATTAVRTLYNAITTTKNRKATTFFKQWHLMFAEACGYDAETLSGRVETLAQHYGVPLAGLRPAELLFALHTYYALFMKLLAAEIITFYHRLPNPIRQMMAASTDAQLLREVRDLEAGGVFRHLHITNFLEGDLFAWYPEVWSDGPVPDVVRGIVAKLDEYNPGTLSEDPARSQDLLKELYQALFPRDVRHDLGEYYTPDWLAEYTLAQAKYSGDPDKRVLDPACGSGTFLVTAIGHVRAKFARERETTRDTEAELCAKILRNVVGFDLNPVAVLAARTNYLIAIRDLISHVDHVELPVYLSDAVMIPSEYGDLFTGTGRTAQVPCSAAKPPHLLVPKEIAAHADTVARYTSLLEQSLELHRSAAEFIEACRAEDLPVSAEQDHRLLYEQLVEFKARNENGIWARIIKNAFAPLFAGKFDFVVGNPPWINWESLPETYRDDTRDVWDSYGLKQRSGGKVSVGETKHEIAALFYFVAGTHYARDNGFIAFVITQSLFKNKGAAGFRVFGKPTSGVYFPPEHVTDLLEIAVFDKAVNRTAVVIGRRGQVPAQFPIQYDVWHPTSGASISMGTPLEEVRRSVTVEERAAFPSGASPTAAWMTAPKRIAGIVKKALGEAYFTAFEGVNPGGLVAAYRVTVLQDVRGLLLVENDGSKGRAKVRTVRHGVEPDCVRPLLRGRNVLRWTAQPEGHLMFPYDEVGSCISETTMRRKLPRTLEYFENFRRKLHLRKSAPVKQAMKREAFYAMLGVGKHSVATHRVVFKDLSELFQCAVVGPSSDPSGGDGPVADYTLGVIPAQSEAEAHYIAAVLNSAPVLATLYYSTTGVQTQHYYPSDVEKISVPPFIESARQLALSKLSMKCHEAALADPTKVPGFEEAIDRGVAKMWGITDNELDGLRDTIAPLRAAKPLATEDESAPDDV